MSDPQSVIAQWLIERFGVQRTFSEPDSRWLLDTLAAAGLAVVPVRIVHEILDAERGALLIDVLANYRKARRKLLDTEAARPSVDAEGRQGQPAGEGEG